MKVIVFAYNILGCIGFESLLKNNYEILALVTHQDDPDEKIYFDSVASLAAANGVKVLTPENPNSTQFANYIKDLGADAIFSFYYRNMISEEIIDAVNGNAYNLHGSLLPKYRGRAPLNWAILNGETETGVTLHKMVRKPDAGAIIGQEKIEIQSEDDAKTMLPKMEKASQALLTRALPLIKENRTKEIEQDNNQSSYFGKRCPEDGIIDWNKPASTINNLVRAVTDPFPGAVTYFGQEKITIWKSKISETECSNTTPGTVININPLEIATEEGALTVITAQAKNKSCVAGTQLASEVGLLNGCILGKKILNQKPAPIKVLILGVNGFIGNALTKRLLQEPNYEVYGMDLTKDKLNDVIDDPRFTFCEGDISIQRSWIEYHVRKCDVILPLVAIATPATYVKAPLSVFELDFEENLRIVRYCAKYNKRIIFPSTSEVYGMCQDSHFDEETSPLITGPINKVRWIYSCSKQLLDRVIWAYGMEKGLQFSLFRPFNWVGEKLDSLDSARLGSSRVLTQFALNLVEGTPIRLVDGGEQKRCFTDLSDGIEGLFKIIENKDNKANGGIFNVGNPINEASIKELAEIMVQAFEEHPQREQFPKTPQILGISSKEYYGKGYQDVVHRRPSIDNLMKLDWAPKVELEESIKNALYFFLQEHLQSMDN